MPCLGCSDLFVDLDGILGIEFFRVGEGQHSGRVIYDSDRIFVQLVRDRAIHRLPHFCHWKLHIIFLQHLVMAASKHASSKLGEMHRLYLSTPVYKLVPKRIEFGLALFLSTH
jgi:hypothetical protein